MDRRASLPSSAFSTGSFVERDPANLLPGSCPVLHSGNRQRWHLGLLTVACVQQTALASSVSMWPDAGMKHQRGHPVPFLYVFIINRCPYLGTHKTGWPPVYNNNTRGFPAHHGNWMQAACNWAGDRPTHPTLIQEVPLAFPSVTSQRSRGDSESKGKVLGAGPFLSSPVFVLL